MRTIRGLALSCHPGPTVVVTTIAVALALGVGQSAAGSVLVAVTVLSGQLSIGWSNDWLDARRDAVDGRVDKPVATGTISQTLVKAAAFSALTVCVPLSFLNGVSSGWAHLGLVGSGWSYNLGLKATLWSWLPYAVGFGLLPAFVTLGLPQPVWPPWWVVVAGALLGVGAHFANVLPDIDTDLAHGLCGLPQRLGLLGAGWVAISLLSGASVLLIVAPNGSPTTLMWLGTVSVLALLVVGARSLLAGAKVSVVFVCAMAVALVDVLLLAESARVLRS